MSKYIDTKSEKIGDKYFCLYCAEECKHETEWWDREMYDIYYCECEGAKAQLEYDKEINNIKEKYKKILVSNEEKLKQLRFIQEIKKLSYKFDIKKDEYNITWKK